MRQPAATTPLVQLHNVSYRYPSPGADEGSLALSEINLSLQQGEFVAILGANGSGKSTLARHLNALLTPSSGTVLVQGLDSANPANHWEIRRLVGMVFQNPDNQMVATVVDEDIAFGPENLGLPREEIVSRVQEALSMVGMSGYASHAPHLLSGGQKQRIAIAGAIAMKPLLLVCDEATAMLDPAGRQEVLDCFVKLHQLGMGIILITHRMSEALLADRVLLMREGKLVSSGTSREILCQVELLRSLGLDAPAMAEIAHRLAQEGLLPQAAYLTISELVQAVVATP